VDIEHKAAGTDLEHREFWVNQIHRGIVDGSGGDLQEFAETVVKHLREHFSADSLRTQQVMCLAEETGEFVGAYRRWAGLARRSGDWDDVEAELADVVITAYVTADLLGIDLDAAWRAKAEIVMTRGWRDTASTDSRS